MPTSQDLVANFPPLFDTPNMKRLGQAAAAVPAFCDHLHGYVGSPRPSALKLSTADLGRGGCESHVDKFGGSQLHLRATGIQPQKLVSNWTLGQSLCRCCVLHSNREPPTVHSNAVAQMCTPRPRIRETSPVINRNTTFVVRRFCALRPATASSAAARFPKDCQTPTSTAWPNVYIARPCNFQLLSYVDCGEFS